jgi:transcriptional regulator with XRE-family HTH domain
VVPVPFAQVLRRQLAEKPLSQRVFARLVNAKQAQVSSVLRGQKPPPLARIEQWADALGLVGQDRFDFETAALLDHAPAELGVLVGRLVEENRRLGGKTSGDKLGMSTTKTPRATRPRRKSM